LRGYSGFQSARRIISRAPTRRTSMIGYSVRHRDAGHSFRQCSFLAQTRIPVNIFLPEFSMPQAPRLREKGGETERQNILPILLTEGRKGHEVLRSLRYLLCGFFLPKGEGRGEGEGDARTADVVGLGFDVWPSPKLRMALCHSPFQASGFAGGCRLE